MADIDRHFSPAFIESISAVLGDTGEGLTGSEIGRFLSMVGIRDVEPGITKWKRLYAAFMYSRSTAGKDNPILAFIAKAYSKERFIQNVEFFRARLLEKNTTPCLDS